MRLLSVLLQAAVASESKAERKCSDCQASFKISTNSPTSDGSECMAPELHSSRRFAKEGTRALLKMGIQARSVGTLQSPSQAK